MGRLEGRQPSTDPPWGEEEEGKRGEGVKEGEGMEGLRGKGGRVGESERRGMLGGLLIRTETDKDRNSDRE